MSDLKLFRFSGMEATELTGSAYPLEKKLQTAIENNMETMFGVKLLASEFSTGTKHSGRIDSIGLDENRAPVIFEYKRSRDENVMNQGLYYLDWLLDHRGDFEVLVREKLGAEDAEGIDWRNPRVICIANDFTKFDEHAISQMNKSIELVRYRSFEDDLLALELVAVAQGSTPRLEPAPEVRGQGGRSSSTFRERLERSSPELKNLYADVATACEALGDDVTVKELKLYTAFRRIKNFACVEVHPNTKEVVVYLKVDPDTVALEPGFSRDVRNIGHFGTGDLEIRIRSADDLQRALPHLRSSYEAS